MLPPKLAQTMINLASGGKTDARKLLDPFCGTGVVLQEAALMKMNAYGTDLEPRMIQYSRENLDWLRRTHHAHFDEELEIGDATSFQWSQPIDLVATETYLGKPYSAEPRDDNLRENIANCNVILTKFLKNLATQITPDTGVCVAVPCWFTSRQAIHLPLIAKLTDLGFEQIFYSDNHENLIYHRENQIVGRELLVLRKKSA
jgi:tRNA (guanine10-N2)-dimethyltransferase